MLMKKNHHMLNILELRALCVKLNLFDKPFYNCTHPIMMTFSMSKAKEAP